MDSRCSRTDTQRRGELIRLLEEALAIAEELPTLSPLIRASNSVLGVELEMRSNQVAGILHHRFHQFEGGERRSSRCSIVPASLQTDRRIPCGSPPPRHEENNSTGRR